MKIMQVNVEIEWVNKVSSPQTWSSHKFCLCVYVWGLNRTGRIIRNISNKNRKPLSNGESIFIAKYAKRAYLFGPIMFKGLFFISWGFQIRPLCKQTFNQLYVFKLIGLLPWVGQQLNKVVLFLVDQYQIHKILLINIS